ncbi:MAG: BtpA/SgcQ family protein [Anaerolineaceae bacterium]|nr:BtpA/SgcQ family protein [Anaerolineaceae bacterium]
MSWLSDIFKTEKPIIAMLHLGAFPGDPLFGRDGSMENIVAWARKDLSALQDGGVDAVIFSNEFSLPYQRKVSIVTIAGMARTIGELMSDIRIPFGVDVISDATASIELAAATGAKFVRGTFTGAYVGDGGIQNTDVAAILRRKNDLRLDDLRLLFFVNQESDVYINDRDIQSITRSVIFKCGPDGLCVSGESAGTAASSELISLVKAVSGDVPVFANTGCNAQNIVDKLKICDGAVVGTAFKADGKFNNHVDLDRVSEFMRVVKDSRKEN